MTREEWARVKGIALEALERPESQRAPYIDAHCGKDAALAAEVESLVASASRATALFEPPSVGSAESLHDLAASTATPDLADPLIGARLSAYRICAELGRGGMGVAYLADRADGAFDKQVAIKVVKRGMDTDAIVRRFVRERRILAALDHPNIARLIDGGTTDDGRHYFVMEYVDGRPLDEHCATRELSVAARLRLFHQVCRAVEHAHGHRIVHGDLKPGNVLVTADGVPKLLDFGIATLVEPGSDEFPNATTMSGRALTPQFASPEQLAGRPLTPASDVYSLGVLLYLLITGRHPYRVDTDSAFEAARIVGDSQPQPPSVVVAGDRGAAEWGQPPRGTRLARAIDAIVMTAMAKDPVGRYGVAGDLATDLQSALDGRPTVAEGLRRHGGYWPLRSAWSVGESSRAWTRARVAPVAAALILGAGVAWQSFSSRGTPSRSAPASIAVIPLTNASGDPELDYLSQGLTRRIAGQLARVTDVRVMTLATGVGGLGDVNVAARRVRAEAVLTGTLARRGETLSVDADVVDLRSGARLWSGAYDADPSDLEGLDGRVVQQLATTLGYQPPSVQPGTRQSETDDAEAYHAYLRGLHFLNRRTRSDLRKSIGYFEQAVGRDPRFAAAFAGLARANGLLTEYHGAPARETYRPARDAALTALQLDPTLSEAHTSIAFVKQFYEWDWEGAEREFRRAIELNPNDPTAHQWYGELLATRGRHDEARLEIQRAVDREPLSLIINAVDAFLRYLARRFDESVRKSEEVIDLDPNFPEAWEFLKRALDQQGAFNRSVAARQRRRTIVGLDAAMTPALHAAATARDRSTYWRNRLAQELVEGATEGLQPFEMAELLAQSGRTDEALDWLAKACEEGDFMMAYAGVIPTMDPLRSEPRFASLLERSCRIR